MLRGSLRVVAVLIAMGPAARAQFNWVGPGSTAPGDYLRGVGVAAFGLGVYNLDTAQADAINVNTAIRWNEYVTMYFARENTEKARLREAQRERNEANWKAIRERIKNAPEERDLMNGGALNTLLDALNDPKIYESSYRSARVALSSDLVRHVPFRINAEGAEFSMVRMIPRGTGKWPIALQDERFAFVRRNYERAVDAALEQQMSGKMSLEAIQNVREAIEGISRALDAVAPNLPDKELYNRARTRIRELQAMAKLLDSDKIERAMGEIDGFAGTTVNDLRVFMQAHNLRFGTASSPEERGLYSTLYEALWTQKQLMDQGINPGK
jgi:hypothetical protein